MPVYVFDELARHVGHDTEVAMYGNGMNVAIECVTCSEVLFDIDNEEAAND